MGRVVETEYGQVTLNGDPRGVRVHQYHRLLLVTRRIRVGLAHEYDDVAAFVVQARTPPLAAVDHIFVAIPLYPALDIGGVGRRDRGLGHAEYRPRLAVEERKQPPVLVFLRAEVRDHFHVSGIRRRTIESLRADMRAPHHLGERCIFEVAESGTIFRVPHEQIPQPGPLGFAFQVVNYGGGVPRRIVRSYLLLVKIFVRIYMLVHKARDSRDQIPDLVGVIEIHDFSVFAFVSGIRRCKEPECAKRQAPVRTTSVRCRSAHTNLNLVQIVHRIPITVKYGRGDA